MVVLSPRAKPTPVFTGSGVNTNLYVDTGSINHYVECDIPTTGRAKLMLTMANAVDGWRIIGNVGSPGQTGTNLYYQLGANGVRDLTQPTIAWPSDAVRIRGQISANGIEVAVFNASGVKTVVGTVPINIIDTRDRTTYAGARPTGDDPNDPTPVTLNNVLIGASDLPLTIGQAVINGVTSPRFEIEYWSDSAPTYTIEFRSVAIVNGAFVVGNVIAAAAAATVAYTSAPGYARLLATNLPTGQSNKYVEATIRQVGRSEAVAKVISHVHNPMRLGDNIFNYMVYGHSGRVLANQWLQGRWAGGEQEYNWARTGNGVIDANGELARFPNGSEGGQVENGFGIVARRVGCPDVPGRQLLTWDGALDSSQIFAITTQGDTAVAGINITRPSANSLEYDSVFDRSVPSQRAADIAFQIRGPAGSTTSMQNVRLYPKSESNRDRIFGELYLSTILTKRRGALRTMQAFETNGGSFGVTNNVRYQTERNWSERATLRNITLGHPFGFPPDVLIDLGVMLDRPMWINSKPGWTQDYMTGIIQATDAKYAAAGLNLPIFLEPGNEAFNAANGFNNYHWNARYAVDIGVSDETEFNQAGGAYASIKGRKAIHELHASWARQALQDIGSNRRLIIVANAQMGGGFYDATVDTDAWAIAPYWGKESDTALWRSGMRAMMRNQMGIAHTVWRDGQMFIVYESALESYAVDDATYLSYTESQPFREDFDEFLGLGRDMWGGDFCNYSDLNTTGAGSRSFGALHYQGSTNSERHNSLNAMQLLLDAGTEPPPIDPPVIIDPPLPSPSGYAARLLFKAAI